MNGHESTGRTLSFQITLCGSYAEVDRDEWNGLLAQSAHPTPFLRHEFLYGLEHTGCTTAQNGWQPLPLLARDAKGVLVGAAPLYAKGHSYGEYVFDWAWADAYERAGLSYFPKLLVGSPFSPIPGTRLLVRGSQCGVGSATNNRASLSIDQNHRHASLPQTADNGVATHDVKAALLDAITAQAKGSGLSSAHILFPDADDVAVARQQGWLIRDNVQFHWQNHGYQAFDDYLLQLAQPKRKKIKAERRKVQQAGVVTRMMDGDDITAKDLAFFYDCYARTYREHRSTPYMSLAFFEYLLRAMPQTMVLCIAERSSQPIASSLLMQSDGVLYGRYWGAVERVDCLHFEVAYYSPIQWAIERGIQRFEGGAQGEHKLARGFEPVKTYSAHWLREPAFQDAVARYLERESRGIEGYVNELETRSPIRERPKGA